MIKPSKIIGRENDPYLLRWHLIPRNPFFNIYLHKFLRSDNDVPHDHPWWSLSIALWGKAEEHYYDYWSNPELCDAMGMVLGVLLKRSISMGRIVVRSPHHIHRMIIDKPFWTLFVTGPRVRNWGFWCSGHRFVPWQEFTNENGNVSSIGKGCD